VPWGVLRSPSPAHADEYRISSCFVHQLLLCELVYYLVARGALLHRASFYVMDATYLPRHRSLLFLAW